MITNDLILLNQLLDQRISEIGAGMPESEYFELFSAEQVMKDDDLSYDELENGIVDGGGDGGIDSIYFFVNGSLFNEDMDISALKKNVSLRLVLIQSKTSGGFSEDGIDKLVASARDLFDLNKDLSQLAGVFNAALLKQINSFRTTYLALASRFPSVAFRYAYATKATEVHPNVSRKVSSLKTVIESLFKPVKFDFEFLDASSLLSLARRSPSRTSSLRLAENPISTGEAGFVCLVALRDYLAFITDEDGHIRSHLFEGNVRDYQGKTEVNKEIRATLDSATVEDFWWLNNGVSIVCSDASLSGKTLTIEDVEIVNGLQTSREVFYSLHGKDLSKEPRNLLVRVLKPNDQASRDRIIKATNSQTPIPASSLRATDKIHRDIEEYLYPRGYYYDRRKNYYKNIGKPIRRILTIPYVAQSVMACALSDPANARARPSSLLKNEEAYRRIFSTGYPLDLFLKCPVIVKRVEEVLRASGIAEFRSHLNNIRFYVAMLCTLRQSGVPRPNIQKVADMDISSIEDASIIAMARDVMQVYQELGGSDQVAKGSELARLLLDAHQTATVGALSDVGNGRTTPPTVP